jgi:hypothetical protein
MRRWGLEWEGLIRLQDNYVSKGAWSLSADTIAHLLISVLLR